MAPISQTIFANAYTFLNENVLLSISLKFIPNGPISNIPALVQIMAWRRPGHYLNQYWPHSLTHVCGIRSRWVKLSGICIHQMIIYTCKIPMYTCKILMHTYRIIMYICKICIHNRMYFYTRQNLFMQLISLCCDVPSGPPYLHLSICLSRDFFLGCIPVALLAFSRKFCSIYDTFPKTVFDTRRLSL